MTEPNAASREARAREILIGIAEKGGDHNVEAVIAAGNEQWIDVSWDEAITAMLALADEAASQPREDTVEFVREWMLSGDYPVDPWTLEFAAAIDARAAPTDQAQRGEVERLRADIRKALGRAKDRLGHVSIDAMEGDNLAVTLCTRFDDADGEQDENGWTETATAGCDATLAAIHQVYVDAFASLAQSGDPS